ncbi:MAG: molybdopterin molybdotransferase MoeA [Gammaproteobacteria bacterium]|jgi:molybdopterin molybdotransferase
MRTTFDRHPPAEAFAWTDRLTTARRHECVALADAAGRILGRDVRAATDAPAESLAAVDGYAVIAADIHGATDYSPLPLRVSQTGERLRPGHATPVQAGDPIPPNADAVVALDACEAFGPVLQVSSAPAIGDGTVRPGEECRRGDLLYPAGHRLRPQDLARTALAGLDELPVFARPRVAVVLAGRFARDVDGPMLTALVRRDGGDLVGVERAGDAASLGVLLTGDDCDLVLVAGGTGFGAADFTVATLAEVGAVELDGVALHPGETLALGRVGDTPVVSLPGSPLACLFAYDACAARALRRLAGRDGEWPYLGRRLTLTRKISSTIGRMEFCRVRVTGGEAEPLATAEDRLLATAAEADGFVVVPPRREGHPAGSVVEVLLYDPIN